MEDGLDDCCTPLPPEIFYSVLFWSVLVTVGQYQYPDTMLRKHVGVSLGDKLKREIKW